MNFCNFNKKKIIILSFLIFIVSNPAYAYLDPGTGSIIITAILGFVAAAITTLNIWWQKIKTFFLSSNKSDNKKDEENTLK
tara:strand:- start:1 stop:243 length:243 start_codon:yes stop_codon:yes gene_type:complete